MPCKFGFAGANITVPHKESALACVDKVDELATRVGAVNTVIVGPQESSAAATPMAMDS